MRRHRGLSRDVLLALQALWRELVDPGEDQGERQAEEQQGEKQANAPGRDAKGVEQELADLEKHPARDRIEDGDPNDVAALELGVEGHKSRRIISATGTVRHTPVEIWP